MALQKRGIPNRLKIDLLYRSVGIADDIVDAKRHLARTLISDGRHSEAVGILNQQISRTPADGELYFHLAVALERLQRTEEARAAGEKAVVKSPKSYWAWNLLAYICICLGDYKSARDYQEIAILLSPQHPDYHGQLARILVRLGQPDEACKAGKKSVDLNPTSGLNWHWYAIALESNGQLQDAVVAAQETVRYDGQEYYQNYLNDLLVKIEQSGLDSSAFT
jgi:tetratricopeptide (TPR) repeat protein